MPGSNIGLLEGLHLLLAIFSRAYCYYYLYCLFNSIQYNREVSWSELFRTLFQFALTCFGDYLILHSGASSKSNYSNSRNGSDTLTAISSAAT
jgi:hypothetical protein